MEPKKEHAERLAELFRLYYTDSASDAEQAELAMLLHKTEAGSLWPLLKQVWNEENGEPFFSAAQSDAVYHSILHNEKHTDSTAISAGKAKVVGMYRWKRYAVAAVLAGLLVAGYWMYGPHQKPEDQPLATKVSSPQDLPPGKEGAVLTLSNGETIVLDSAGNGTLASQGKTQVIKQGTELRYEGQASGEAHYNTMHTPRGRQFRLKLADGSLVWLNASSSITFPTAFSGIERVVQVKGEVYFEIAPDRTKPFKVKLHDGSVIQVLGTHFNVNSYEDEGGIRTTLLEGSVLISKGSERLRLAPGQQAFSQRKEVTLINDARLEEVMAWKNGFFSFRDTELKAILRQLSRWYDVDVVYQGQVPGVRFSGELGRDLSLTQVLDILKETRIKYKIEGKKLFITP